MTIYIEYVLIDNLVIDSIILLLTAKALKQNVPKMRILLSSALGTAFAFLTPLVSLPTIITIILKLIIGLLMVLVAFKFKSAKYYAIAFLIFLGFTFVMGGACIGFLLMTSSNFTLSNNINYNSEIPVGLVVGLVALFYLVMRKLIGYMGRKKQTDEFVYKTEIYEDERKTECNAFLDSGNKLYDTASGKCVNVINLELFERLYGGEMLMKILCGKTDKLKDAHYIKFNGITEKQSKMLAFSVEKIVIYSAGKANIIEKPMLALNIKNFHGYNGCDMLVCSDLISGQVK